MAYLTGAALCSVTAKPALHRTQTRDNLRAQLPARRWRRDSGTDLTNSPATLARPPVALDRCAVAGVRVIDGDTLVLRRCSQRDTIGNKKKSEVLSENLTI